MISIIVPMFNCEKSIEKCIESILIQTYKDWELILIDDGSEDNTVEICEKYVNTNKNIKLYLKENGGVSSARNYGLDISKSEYVLFIDADDYIDITAIEKLIENLDDKWLIGLKRKIINDNAIAFEKNKTDIISYKEFCKEVLEGNKLGGVWGYLFKSQSIGELKFDINTGYMEDFLFLIKYLEKNHINRVRYVSDNCFYNYINNANGITHSKANIVKKVFDIDYTFGCINAIIPWLKKYVENDKAILIERQIINAKYNEIIKIKKDVRLKYKGKKIRYRVFSRAYNMSSDILLRWYIYTINVLKKFKNKI